MIRKFILPIVAILGILFAVFMIFYSKKEPKIPPIASFPPDVPYKHFVAGEGIVEASSENIKIGVPFPDLIENVYVKAGDKVKKGTLLFKIDARRLEALKEEAIRKKETAIVNYKEKKIQFSFYQNVDNRAVSEEEYTQNFYEMKIAKKKIKEIQASIYVIETDIERTEILAPIDGEALQVNVKKGQFANVNPYDKRPLILFGDTSFFHIRVDIDEEEAWKIKKNAKAIAFVRGNSSFKVPLEFVKIEPYLVGKKSLTGENTEKVDTRVLQVIFKFYRKNFPIYVGQLMDVYIEILKEDVYEGLLYE